MTSLYTENSEKWKSLASIDYFTQFIKAWIPFNAWYKNYYPNLKTDREAIDEIKSHPNNFRNKLISLLNDRSNDGIFFRASISELYLELERKHIFNKNKRITFEEIVIEKNTIRQNSFEKNTLTYKVEREIKNRPSKEIDIYIVKSDGNNKFYHIQSHGFDLIELTSNCNFLRLSQPQQSNLKACYEEINPSKSINLLSNEPENCIKMGSIYFINDTNKLCKGIIEILYSLRNVLFHGEIIPDNDTNKVYEPAYHILYTLIQAL
ncbi:MAG: hypothetical protein ACRC2R_02215 [Xenococcaceae cyanobacterium]